MASRRRILIAASATALLAAAAAPAAPAAVDVDVAPSGVADLAWTNAEAVRERSQAADGTFGAVTVPGAGEVKAVVTAVDSAGNATLVWNEGIEMKTRRRFADGQLSPVELVARMDTTGEAMNGRVAVDPRGGAVIVWTGPSYRSVLARRVAADGTLSPVQALAGSNYVYWDTSVAVDAQGNVTVVWDRAYPNQVQTRRWRSDGTLGPTTNLAAGGKFARGVRVALDADGRAVFVWLEPVGNFPDGRGPVTLQTRTRRLDGSLSPRIQLTPPDAPANPPSYDFALHPAGGLVATWAVSGGVKTRRLTKAGQLSSVDSVATGSDMFDPRVAVDASGSAVHSWLRGYHASQRLLYARRRASDGTFGTIKTVSTAAGVNGTRDVDMDAASDGTATFLWRYTDAEGATRFATRRLSADSTLGPITQLPVP